MISSEWYHRLLAERQVRSETWRSGRSWHWTLAESGDVYAWRGTLLARMFEIFRGEDALVRAEAWCKEFTQ